MTEFQRILNAIVIHKSNTVITIDFKVLVIVIHYIDSGSNSNSNILH